MARTMTSEASRELVKNVWAAFASRDEDIISPLFAPDAQWIAPPANATAVALGVTDHMKGATAIAAFVAKRMKLLYQDVSVKFVGFYADGPVVVVEEEMSATLTNGLPYKLTYCFIFECRDDVVVRVREYMDTMSGYRQVFAAGHPLSEHLPLSPAA